MLGRRKCGARALHDVVVRCTREGFSGPLIRSQPSREACVPDRELHQFLSVLFVVVVVLFSDSLVGLF